MRLLLVTVLLLAAVVPAWGAGYAIDQGAVYFSGQLSFGKDYGPAYDRTWYTVQPGFHYFLFSGLSVGLDLDFQGADDAWGGGSTRVTSTGGLVSAAYFFGKKAALTFPFVSLGAGGGSRSGGGLEVSYSALRLATGVNFLFNDYIGLLVSATWSLEKVSDTRWAGRKDGGRLFLGAGIALFLF